VTAAAGSWVVGVDNLSTIPAWWSDALCRAVTGDGDVRRKLYSDADLTVFASRRVVLLNGIDLGVVRDDLSERLLTIDLHRRRQHHRGRALPRVARHHQRRNAMTDRTPDPTPDPQITDDATKPNEAERRRTERRSRALPQQTEPDRGAARQHRRPAHRIPARRGRAARIRRFKQSVRPLVGRARVAELLDDDGEVDADKVSAQVAAVLDGRPGLAAVIPPRIKSDRSQASQGSVALDSGWSAPLKGGSR
jgi:hypothetical protein